MLEHQKLVLRGVSDNKDLFKKELFKSLRWLNEKEQKKLREWAREKFYHLHSAIIDEVFYTRRTFA